MTRVYPNGRGVFDIDLRLGRGQSIGLMGANGSGKTTLLRVLATAQRADSGRVRWFGEADPCSPSVRRRLGVVLDHTAHFDQLSGEQNALFFAAAYGVPHAVARRRLAELMEWAGLAAARHLKVAEYSLGMRRRLALVEALCHQPELLILDEPTLALDHIGARELAERLNALVEAGAALVVATNDVQLSEQVCERVILLRHGRAIGIAA